MGVTEWVEAYERAWRAPGTDAIATLFTPDASYLQGPFHRPIVGLPAIAAMWEEERDGPDETFEMSHEVVAVDGDTAVVSLHIRYGRPVNQEWRDLWILRFAGDGRCRWFEEWPIAPGDH